MSDKSAHFKQIHEHARILRIDISSARAAGANASMIEAARRALAQCVELTKAAIEKGTPR